MVVRFSSDNDAIVVVRKSERDRLDDWLAISPYCTFTYDFDNEPILFFILTWTCHYNTKSIRGMHIKNARMRDSGRAILAFLR